VDPYERFKQVLANVLTFCRCGGEVTLRGYQEKVALAIIKGVKSGKGLTFVVMYPRQSGKNELQSHLEAYLLVMCSNMDMEMVKVSPTWKPQSLNAMRRLERTLAKNLMTRDLWCKEQGYIYRIGETRIYFLSGGPTANVVGATANLLLSCDEAQDVQITKWDKDFSPMAASTNATRVFWGTAWTSRTLLARELRAARKSEEEDGIKRVFVIDAEAVAKEVPAYGAYVAEQIRKLGRNHPLIKTQYFCEEIDAEGGMFPPERRVMMKGDHPRKIEPESGGIYAFCIDVAGEDEAATNELGLATSDQLRNPGRDATALTIFEIDLKTLKDPLINAPTYRVMNRMSWVGISHTKIYGELRGLADLWDPRYLVVDATGVGAGLASFLDKAFSGKVLPFTFTMKSKSDLGWNFLAVCDTGRFKDHVTTEKTFSYDWRDLFWLQLEHTQYEALENKVLRWSVPDGTRDLATGELVHDDLVLSAALVAVLDEQEWYVTGKPLIVRRRDPLEEMDEIGF
jgi:hypothetical protein